MKRCIGKCSRMWNTVLSNTPVLRLFGEHKELALQCDAFELVLRACLFPIMYASRSLTETKNNYDQIDRSFSQLALLWKDLRVLLFADILLWNPIITQHC